MLSVDFIPSAWLSTANQWLRFHPLQLQLRYLLRPLLRLLGTLLQIRQLDLAKLSIAAIGFSLEKVKTMASYLANLSRDADYKYDPRMSQSLHLCLDLVDGVGGAVDKIQKSLKQMRDLGAAGSSEERPRSLLFNVQTWITGGPFDHSACADSFDDVADGPLKEDIIARALYARIFTTIALVWLNAILTK
ncbi:pectinesterase inhibitor 9-like [Mangifera indica]|uniref:pectinesterase inhibitor 9-like n=1 Tax=Mangifera indica TaxID=29780 RepID=UPI001CFABEF8|nr:pectinesterase inhibitor 9-like [Mangifera indica]